jgi:hypothetical protein
MDSLPGRSRRYQPSSLLGVPQDLCIEIVAHVGVTSEWPLADLRSLRGTCSTMRRVCDHSDVGRRLSIEGIRDEISWVWNPTSYKAFLAMQTGLGHPEACFHSGIKPFFIEHRGYNISGTPLRVGTMRRPIYTSYFSTETMAVPPPPTPRSGTWGWSRAAAVQRRDGWATRGVCLCVRRPRVRSTTRLGAFGVNRCYVRHRCAAISRAQATAAATAWKKDGFEFLSFAAKIVGCAAKWWSSHRVLNRKWVVDYLLYDAQIICVKFWESSKSDEGYQPRVANDFGAQFYSNEEQLPFLLLICNQML